MAQLLYIFLCGLVFSGPKSTEQKKTPACLLHSSATEIHAVTVTWKSKKELQILVFKVFVLIGKKEREWGKEGTNTFFLREIWSWLWL